MTDAHTDGKLVEIHEEWGMWGLGVWWDLVSRVAARYSNTEKPVAHLNVKELCQFYSKKRRKLSEFFVHIERLRLCKCLATAWPRIYENNLCVIEIPNITKIKDNHHRNLQVTCKSLASKEVEVEVDVEEEKETDPLSHPQKSDTPSQNHFSQLGDTTDEPPPHRQDPDAGTSAPTADIGKAEAPGCDPPPFTAGGLSRVGEVAAGLVGDTGRTAALLADPRPIGAENDEILKLKQMHADLFDYQINPEKVKGDLSCRILDALRAYGLKKCQAAIDGHFKEATKEGSSRGKGFEHAFPPQRQKNKLDRDRFWTLVIAGQNNTGKAARSTYKPPPKISEDERQEAAAKGLAAIREQLERNK